MRKRVAVTRPEMYLGDAVRLLEEKGLEAVPVPMMELVPRKDGAVEKFLERLEDGQVDAAIFTSQNGVKFVLEGRQGLDGLVNKLSTVTVLAIGPKTASTLRNFGVAAVQMPSTFSSQGLVSDYCKKLKGKRVEMLRSSHGSPALYNGLVKCCKSIKDTVVYDIVPMDGERQRVFILEAVAGKIDAFTFTSTMTVKSLLVAAESIGLREELKAAINIKKVAAIGNPTAATLKENGIHIDAMPDSFTFEAMVDELVKVL